MANTDKIDARLNNVYQNDGDKQGIFDQWAATYDHDLVNELGYVADVEACRVFESLVTDKSAWILDAGCGTGLVGIRLKRAGYEELHGSDYSQKMLEKAEATGAYRSLQQHDLTLPIETRQAYDAAIAVGLFGFNEPSVEHLVNITCALKVGGLALVTVNGKAWRETEWETRLDCLKADDSHTQLIDISTIDYLTADGIDGRLLTLKRIK